MGTIAPTPTASVTPSPPDSPNRWTAGRIAVLVTGALLLLGSAGLLVAAFALDECENQWRDGDYLTSDPVSLHTEGYALAVDDIDVGGLNGDWLLGRARVRIAVPSTDEPVFIGIANKADAAAYLRGVEHSVVTDISDSTPRYATRSGAAPTVRPADAHIWTAQSTGTGRRSLEWTPEDGSWTVVVMKADATERVDVTADVGATLPVLDNVISGLRIGSAFAALAGVGLLGAGLLRRRDTP